MACAYVLWICLLLALLLRWPYRREAPPVGHWWLRCPRHRKVAIADSAAAQALFESRFARGRIWPQRKRAWIARTLAPFGRCLLLWRCFRDGIWQYRRDALAHYQMRLEAAEERTRVLLENVQYASLKPIGWCRAGGFAARCAVCHRRLVLALEPLFLCRAWFLQWVCNSAADHEIAHAVQEAVSSVLTRDCHSRPRRPKPAPGFAIWARWRGWWNWAIGGVKREALGMAYDLQAHVVASFLYIWILAIWILAPLPFF